MVFKNDKAVSPVVATLVLVVVAIIGAAAVGALLGAFSSDVSDEASAGETSSASSTELLIGGSTTVQPVTEILADAFMEDHKGIKVTVQGGGSGAGIAGAEQNVLDIGSSSKTIVAAEHPDLEVFEIGGSAVVLIASTGVTVPATVTANDVEEIYTNCANGVTDATAPTTLGAAGLAVYQRSESSGTEETFAKFLDAHKSAGDTVLDGDNQLVSNAKGFTGNAGVYNAVKSAGTTPAIGFVDYGFVGDGNTEVQVVGVECQTSQVTSSEIENSLKVLSTGTGTANFPTGLCRNLYYCTLSTPSATEKTFIDFAKSPGAIDYFHDAGYYSIYDYI